MSAIEILLQEMKIKNKVYLVIFTVFILAIILFTIGFNNWIKDLVGRQVNWYGPGGI